jgi:outer membrane protein TolC
MKSHTSMLILVFFLYPPLLPAEEQPGTLEKLLSSLVRDNGVIEAKKGYEAVLLEQRYRYLQWWRPSLSLSNDLVYPYEDDKFDNLAASNRSSLVLSAPLPTGTLLDFTASYGLSRDMPSPETWGFAQDLQGKIGIGQSLNPWWLHSGSNPYTAGASLRTNLARNEYNSAVKAALSSCIQSYISLRKAERSRDLLTARISLYDEMLSAYREMRDTGGVSWREIQNIRKDKWEDEESLFSLEQDINTLQSELYQMTGIHAGTVSSEPRIALNNPIWPTLFLNTQIEDIRRLEETGVHIQKESLRHERLISRQSSAPLLKFEFGSSFNLPVKEKNSLDDAWHTDNFTDNILNNWSVTISLDLSGLLSPLNKKNEASYRLSQNTLDKLLENIYANKEKEKNQLAAIIAQLEDHIAQLTLIIQEEEKNIQDDKILFEQGALTELEYRQSLLEYQSKQTLLENFTDDLWLYQFIHSFYPQ